MKLSDKIIEVVEKEEFSIGEVGKQNEEYYVDINQYTPCGEDWWEVIWFDGTDKGFIKGVRARYENFDVDEEVEPYIECRGENGVPSSIKDLVEDGEWKKEKLGELKDELWLIEDEL